MKSKKFIIRSDYSLTDDKGASNSLSNLSAYIDMKEVKKAEGGAGKKEITNYIKDIIDLATLNSNNSNKKFAKNLDKTLPEYKNIRIEEWFYK